LCCTGWGRAGRAWRRSRARRVEHAGLARRRLIAGRVVVAGVQHDAESAARRRVQRERVAHVAQLVDLAENDLRGALERQEVLRAVVGKSDPQRVDQRQYGEQPERGEAREQIAKRVRARRRVDEEGERHGAGTCRGEHGAAAGIELVHREQGEQRGDHGRDAREDAPGAKLHGRPVYPSYSTTLRVSRVFRRAPPHGARGCANHGRAA